MGEGICGDSPCVFHLVLLELIGTTSVDKCVKTGQQLF